MYKRANTVYPILQQLIQKVYPVINQILGKRYPGRYLIFQKRHPAGRHQHIYCKSIEEFWLLNSGPLGVGIPIPVLIEKLNSNSVLIPIPFEKFHSNSIPIHLISVPMFPFFICGCTKLLYHSGSYLPSTSATEAASFVWSNNLRLALLGEQVDYYM